MLLSMILIIIVIVLTIAVVDLHLKNKSLRKQAYKIMRDALRDENKLQGKIQILENELRRCEK